MVREVRFSCHATDRLRPPVCRESVLDDGPTTARPAAERRAKRSRKAARPAKRPAAAAPAPAATCTAAAREATAAPARPATARRHLAGADWLTGYLPPVRKAR